MYRNILYEYEMILLGKKNSFSNFFFSETPDRNEAKALYVIRFALEGYLKWTPEQVKNGISYAILDELKLTPLLKFVRFPPELSEEDDMYFLTGKLYPKLVNIDIKTITLKVYERVLAKDLYKFPKEYLSGNQIGMQRAIICFQHMLEQFGNFKNSKEAYKLFGTAGGTTMLKKYRLNMACASLFDYPIDFLHTALPKDERNEFWYRFYKFKICSNEQARALKKKQNAG